MNQQKTTEKTKSSIMPLTPDQDINSKIRKEAVKAVKIAAIMTWKNIKSKIKDKVK